MAICIKASAPHVPPGEAVFFRSFFAIPVILGWLAWTELRHGLDTLHPMGHVWRGLVGTTAMGLGFTALGLLPLPEATALGYAAPLLTVIFAAMFLGEQVRVFRLSAVFFGLVGVMIVLSPRLTLTGLGDASKLQTIGAFAALLGAVFAALAQVFVRKLVHTEATAAIVFYFSVTATVLSLVTLPFGWAVPTAARGGAAGRRRHPRRRRPDPADRELPPRRDQRDRALRVRLDAAGAGARLLRLRRAPHPHDAVGAALIVPAGLFIIWRERKLGIERAGFAQGA